MRSKMMPRWKTKLLRKWEGERKEAEAAQPKPKTKNSKKAALAFWMKRELTEDEKTEIEDWRKLVQMPPGVWQRTWEAFGEGVAHYTTTLLDGLAHLDVRLPRQRELWWEIKLTAAGSVLSLKIGSDYPEMMRECFGESLERIEGANENFVAGETQAKLLRVLREGEVLIQDWIAHYAQEEP